jgi:hypothetical protein
MGSGNEDYCTWVTSKSGMLALVVVQWAVSASVASRSRLIEIDSY